MFAMQTRYYSALQNSDIALRCRAAICSLRKREKEYIARSASSDMPPVVSAICCLRQRDINERCSLAICSSLPSVNEDMCSPSAKRYAHLW